MTVAVRKLDAKSTFRHSSPVTENWAALGREARSRRVQLGFNTAGDFAKSIGMSSKTVGRVENGIRVNKSTLARITTGLGWTLDSADNIVYRNGKPTLADGATATGDAAAAPEHPGAAATVPVDRVDELFDELLVHATGDPEVVKDAKLLLIVLQRLGTAAFRRAVTDLARKYGSDLPDAGAPSEPT